MEPRYIFIVGLPRTGTKLMQNTLENAQDVKCIISPENFFLGRVIRPGVRRKMRKIGDMSDDANVRRLVDCMYAGKFSGEYWWRLRDGRLGVDRETMLQKILDTDRSDREIYAVLLRVHAELAGNTVLGDKSGPHLYRVPTLLEWFPDAKIIHTFRDPRAILASEYTRRYRLISKRFIRKRPTTFPYKLVDPFLTLTTVGYITVAWLYAARLHFKYRKRYPNNYYLSKFEDLVSEPERSVRQLCEFLDLQFHSGMLNPGKVDSSFGPRGGTGFDKQALDRWKDHLKPWMNMWVLLVGKKYLSKFGYIH
jgi:hypothetical protein